MFKKLRKLDMEAVRYIIVGALTTLVNLTVFSILCKLLHFDVTLSNIISVISAILFAYVTNKIFVFHSKTRGINELLVEASKFIGARLITMVIEVGGVFLLVNIIGQDEFVGKLETQFIVLIGNYFISKFLVFRGGK